MAEREATVDATVVQACQVGADHARAVPAEARRELSRDVRSRPR